MIISIWYETRLQTKYRLIITVRIEVLTTVYIKITVSMYVTSHNNPRLYGVTSQKSVPTNYNNTKKKLYEISIFCLTY